MTDKTCYGAPLEGSLTPDLVRDAILNCFKIAHQEVFELNFEDYSDEEKKKFEDLDVRILIQSLFDKVGGSFDQPTKVALYDVVNELADYGRQFRSTEIVEKHFYQIKDLIDRIPDDPEN